MRALLRDILLIVVAAIVITLLMQAVIQKSDVNGYCMEPGLQDGQQLLINKVVYYFDEPQRGDIIVFHPPPPYSSEATPFIKRIVGLPGEVIEVMDRNVYINGSKLDEPYIAESPIYRLKAQIIPEDEYFVLGDNRNNANDSHIWGTVPRQNIIGKAWVSIWPLGEWGLIPDYSFNEQLETSASK
ncbi:signal peptidase I [Chloroflexota bacterium]